MEVSGKINPHILCSPPNTSGSPPPPSHSLTPTLKRPEAEVFGHPAQTLSQTLNPAEQQFLQPWHRPGWQI